MGSTSTPGRLHVLVAGGGIGGLAAAIALRKQGHEVEFRFLDGKCDVKEQKTFTDEEKAQWPSTWWLASRIDLHNALKQKAASPDGPGVPVKIHTASGVDSVNCKIGSIVLSDGTTVTGDLVICADGIHSKTRRSVLGREVPLYGTGNACYRWLVPTSLLAEDPDTKMFVSMPGHFVQLAAGDRRIVFYPVAGGAVQNCAAFVPRGEVGEIKRGASGYDQSVNKEQFISHFTDFAQPLRRMLELAPEESIKLWDLLDMELQPSFIKERAVLIGDAAHPLLPYLGQGAAQAIEDACALGVVFPPDTPAEEIPQRLELWQRIRKDRAWKIVEDTRRRGREVDGAYNSPETRGIPLLGLGLLALGLLLLGGGGLPLLNDLEQGWGVGANELVDLLAVLEDVEAGHGADAVLLRQVGQRVDVDLGEVDFGHGLGPPVEVRRG
ncbi:hypothetical protein VMCG_06300 [Cytospora schulzeri]|uniref:FAD-binding domain-containing protein n=1 Tax=Cytospora schulzeri TaxID=448051 RepID=A0A423W7Y3_9PEZI|nr:hypothetical protein VMCG_06300 [Valsa malicola]